MPGANDEEGCQRDAQASAAESVRNRRARVASIFAGTAAVVAVWALAASRWIVGDAVVPWDSKNQFYPFFRFMASALDAGATPFWNPYHYGGHPSIADPQSLIFSPAFAVWAAFDAAPSMRAFDLVVFAHLLLGGLAMSAIGWRARWPLSGCVLAAAVFMLGGAAAGRLQHTGIILGYALFPLALLLLQLALQRKSFPSAVAFGVTAGLLALGRNQVALLLCFLLAAAAMAEIVVASHPLRYLRTRLPLFATMFGVGFALVAVPMLLTLQFAALSNRPTELIENALMGSLYPANLATLAVPNVFGSHGTYWGPGGQTLPETAYTDDSFNYMFVGAIPVVLVLWLGVIGGRAWRRDATMMTIVLALAILFMLGRYTPVFPLAFEWVPGLDLFRRPVDANFLVAIAVACLSGHLLNDYVREGVPRPNSIVVALVGIGVVGILTWAVAFSARTGHGTAALVEIAKSAIAASLVVLVLTLARTASARSRAAMLVAVAAVAELLWWNAAFRLNADRRTAYAVLEQPAPRDAEAIAVLERALHADRARGERPRVEIVGMGGPWQNLAVVRGWEATNGYNPLRVGFYDRLVAPGETNWLLRQREFPASFVGFDCALARALGLSYLVLGRPIEEISQLPRRPVADVLMAGPRAWIYRMRNPMPRLSFSRHVQVADADATTSGGGLLASPAPDRVLIDDDTPPSRSYGPSAVRAGDARIVAWRPDRVDIQVDAAQAGVLALHNIYYPGWVAEIDGRATPILRADVMFRGIEVPQGRHHVVVRFAPLSSENLTSALMMLLR